MKELGIVPGPRMGWILHALLEEVEKGFLKYMRVGFVSAIPASQFDYAKEVLAKKLKAMAPTVEAAE